MAEVKQFGEVLTVDETAGYLRLCKATVYRYYRTGKIPGQKIGNKLRFSKKALESFLDETKKQKE